MWKTTSLTQQNNLSSRRHTSDRKSGVYDFTRMHKDSPKMESPSSNNNILMENSQLTDTSTNIGEWLAHEEASLEDISMNRYYGQTDRQTSHGSSVKLIKNLLFTVIY